MELFKPLELPMIILQLCTTDQRLSLKMDNPLWFLSRKEPRLDNEMASLKLMLIRLILFMAALLV